MRISEIRIDSFGHWKGLRVPDLTDGVTVIYGRNEAGKSTLLQLVRAVLYGFSLPEHRRFVPSLHGGPIGGTVFVSAPNGKYRIDRHLPESAGSDEFDRSDLSVKSVDGLIKGKHALSTLLAGVDESLFQSVFAVGLTEMQQLGTLSDTEAAQQLFGLASGSDRVSIADVARKLDQWRSRLVDDNESGIRRHLARKADLLDESRQAQKSTAVWLDLRDAKQRLNDELNQLEQRRQGFGAQIDGSSPNQEIRELWSQCQQLQQQLDELGPLPEIPADSLERLDQLTSQVLTHRRQWEQIRERRRELKTQAQQLESRPVLLQHAEPLESLRRQRVSIGSLVDALKELRTEAEETEFELQAEMERLGMASAWQVESMPMITYEVVQTLREPARRARDARRELEAIRTEREQADEELKQAREQLAQSLGSKRDPDLNALWKTAQTHVDHLRQRINCDNQLVRLRRQQEALREDIRYWTQRQILTWRGLLLVGAIFSLGIAVMLISLFSTTFGISSDRRWMVTIIGAAICFVSVVVKNVVTFAASRTADSARDELEELQAHAQQLSEQAEQIDHQLPDDSRPLPVRLQEKQAELDRLTNLRPLEAKRLTAEQKVEATAAHVDAAEQRLRAARSDWRETVRKLGLPEGMTPTQFGRLSQRDGKLGTLREKLIDLKGQIDQRAAELEVHLQRVKLLAERVDVDLDANSLEEQIDQLVDQLHDAQAQLKEREDLHRTWRQLRQEQEAIARSAKRLQARRRKLVAKYGLIDAQDLKTIVHRRGQAGELRAQRDKTLKQVSRLVGPCISPTELQQRLTDGGFEDQLQEVESEQRRVVSRIAELRERRGELNEKLKSVVRNRQTLSIKLEQGEVRQQLTRTIHQWAAWTGIRQVLKTVQKSYENDQQPATLADASSYLCRMTEGRYQRIWTPFGESTLRVDTQDGRSAGVELLSRGTREQLFLSLRLALAAAYGRRGALMPVILDDVLVNFDAARVAAAAHAICEFASAGHQVLVFTCHDHIREVFQHLNVDIRPLPSPKNASGQNGEVLPDDAPRKSTTQLAAAAPVGGASEEMDGDQLPDSDPELDHELMYGAPEYDPGYRAEDAAIGRPTNGSENVRRFGDPPFQTSTSDELPTAAGQDWRVRYNAEVEDSR